MRPGRSPLTPRARCPTSGRQGFLLLEGILAGFIFLLLAATLTGASLFGEQSTLFAGQRARAAMLCEEGLEATRQLRDADFSNMVDGSYGLVVADGQWVFSVESDTTDGFDRVITVASLDEHRKQVTSSVDWEQDVQRHGSVSAVTYFTDWQAEVVSDCPGYCRGLQADYLGGSCQASPDDCVIAGGVTEAGGDSFCADPLLPSCCCTL